MGSTKKMVMAVVDDDMVDLSLIPEMTIINQILDEGFGSDYPIVPQVEGIEADCSE